MYSPSFVKLQFNPPVVTWIILLISLLRFWTLIVVITLPSIEDQRALGINKKYRNLCSEDEWRFYEFGMTWGWVINDRIFIFGWTIPLMNMPRKKTTDVQPGSQINKTAPSTRGQRLRSTWQQSSYLHRTPNASAGLYLAKHFLFAISPTPPTATTTKLCLRSTCAEKFPNTAS